MSELGNILDEIYNMNQKVIESLIAGKSVDADYFAQEIKVFIDKCRKHSSENEVMEGDAVSELIYSNSVSDNSAPVINVGEAGNKKVEFGDKLMPKGTDASDITVLVVDDNELNLEIAEAILKSAGYRVLLADSARRAITLFSNSLAGDIQVILTDIAMPGMDGNEMTKEIRNIEHPDAKSVKIIALSAIRTDASVKMAFASGMNGYIKKPFDIAQFKRILM